MVSLFGRFKNPFDLSLAFAVSPGSQQVSHGVDLEYVLKLHGELALEHMIQRDIENWMGRPARVVGG